jgi:5-carboxymethyl-2-hydroxymuconate isomerase
MANTKKMTKAQMFAQIKANHNLSADEIAFIDHELELLAKKNSAEKKPTAQQVANGNIAEAIVAHLSAEPNRLFTITEIIKEVPECADLTNQRVSAIVRGLIGTSVERVEEKRKAFFRAIA